MNKYVRLFNTVKYLKPIQVSYRLFYLLRGKYKKILRKTYSYGVDSTSHQLELLDSIQYYSTFNAKTFTLLNISHVFDKRIDWNFSEYGKLWTYNLTYFEYLDTPKDVGIIYDFIDNIDKVKDGLEPFPISLRGYNWIKFLTKYNIKDKKIDDSLYAQYLILFDNLEYHLLGNHLLENAFSLLFGAYYFQDEIFYSKAVDILRVELETQILEDGAHFELSPMYHQLMLFRLLDCINLVSCNNYKNKSILEFLSTKATLMLSWLNKISFNNGDIPLFNDSTNQIAPTTKQLLDYSKCLGIQYKNTALATSGYRKIVNKGYECLLDIGKIGPDYIPGHAHADTFNFELYLNNMPFIVDTGLSTYQIGERRDLERGTRSHNTVEVLSTDSSEVWGGFRVAERANVFEISESESEIKATHDGYNKSYGILHTRIWSFEEEKITVVDELSSVSQAVARLHFHPNVTESEVLKRIHVIDKATYIEIKEYDFAFGFNRTRKALVVEIGFKQRLRVEIKI